MDDDEQTPREANARVPFRAGDKVYHRPTQERWILACDEVGDAVYPCGWPETRASSIDCEVLTRSTDTERTRVLRMSGRPGESSERCSYARAQLEAMGIAPE